MPRLPAPNDFDGWVRLLARTQRRKQAMHHLTLAGSPALPAIRRGLRQPEPIVRRACVGILDRLVDEESLPDLVAALDDEDPEVCARALHALACDRCKQNECRPSDDVFVPRAIELLRTDANPDIRAAAIDALGKVARRRPDAAAALDHASAHDANRDLRGMALRRHQRARVAATSPV